MITIKFTINVLPMSEEKYRLVTDTEGELCFCEGNTQLIHLNNILLVEFAMYVDKWLKSENSIFEYISMDFEEEPILRVNFNNEDLGYIESNLNLSVKDTVIEKKKFSIALRVFMDCLYKKLIDKKINVSNYNSPWGQES